MNVCPKRAVILAAGVGRRLRPLTYDQPKGLVDVQGKALLHHQLQALVAAGVEDVVIVTGYRQAQLREAVECWRLPFHCVEWVVNEDYATTNTLVSVSLAAPYVLGHPFVLINGDVWLSPRALDAFSALPQTYDTMQSFLVVDATVTLDEEAMKVRLGPTGNIVSISKTMPVLGAYGESIGVYLFGAASGCAFLEQVQRLNSQPHLFYEAALAMALDAGLVMRPLHIDACTWAEVDDASDLQRARQYATATVRAQVDPMFKEL